MIWKGKEVITGAWWRRATISTLYRGLTMIWQSISSCFGGSNWMQDYTWNNDDTWKNEN